MNYQYDSNSRLIQINQGTQAVTINHDSIGRRTSMTLPNGIVTTYNYDTASRLLNITYASGSQIIKSIDYTYDKNSNRTSSKGHQMLMPSPFKATYNQANQMITFNSQPVTHDDNGNMLSNGDTSYQWSARNQLIGITSPNYNASFKYDAFGRRIEKNINGKTINYLYDGWDIMQEIEDGTVTTNYLRSLNIDETLGIFRQEGAYYYLHDALGSTIALTGTLGNIATEYVYDPYGNTTTTNPNIYNPFQYTGRENDGNGIYNYRLRTKLGERFISEDPIGFHGGINFYSYVGNNPVNFTDPSGKAWWTPIEIIVEAIGEILVFPHGGGQDTGECTLIGESEAGDPCLKNCKYTCADGSVTIIQVPKDSKCQPSWNFNMYPFPYEPSPCVVCHSKPYRGSRNSGGSRQLKK